MQDTHVYPLIRDAKGRPWLLVSVKIAGRTQHHACAGLVDAPTTFAPYAAVCEITEAEIDAAKIDGRLSEVSADECCAAIAWASYEPAVEAPRPAVRPLTDVELDRAEAAPEPVVLRPRMDRPPMDRERTGRMEVRTAADLHRLMGGLTTSTREERHAYAAQVLGKPVASFKDLDPAELRRVASRVRSVCLA